MVLAAVEAGLVAWWTDETQIGFLLYMSETTAAELTHIRRLWRVQMIRCEDGQRGDRGMAVLTDTGRIVLNETRRRLEQDNG